MAENGKNDLAQMFQQIMQQLTQGGAPDAFDFTTEPTALPTESLSLNFDKITVIPPPIGDGHNDGFFVLNRSNQGPASGPSDDDDGGIIIDWFPMETIRPMESLLI